jgi:hypothetical protein
MKSLLKGAHKRTSLASESGWARVPMSQTRPCVECHEPESTHACVVKYIRAWLPSQAPRGGLASQTRTCMGTLRRTERKHVYWSSCRYPLLFLDFNEIRMFLTDLRKLIKYNI